MRWVHVPTCHSRLLELLWTRWRKFRAWRGWSLEPFCVWWKVITVACLGFWEPPSWKRILGRDVTFKLNFLVEFCCQHFQLLSTLCLPSGHCYVSECNTVFSYIGAPCTATLGPLTLSGPLNASAFPLIYGASESQITIMHNHAFALSLSHA